MKNGRLLISDVTRLANENLDFNEQWKERFTSSQCSKLGFQRSKGERGKAVIIWSESLIERLRQDIRYSQCFNQALSETSSERSESSLDASKDTIKQVMNPNWMRDAQEVQP